MGTEMPEQAPWTVDAYETEQGERPALSFLQGLEGRNMFLPNRVAVLLDGEIKKRDDIPAKTLERVRGYQKEVVRRKRGSRQEKER
jgi:hypothetical protein